MGKPKNLLEAAQELYPEIDWGKVNKIAEVLRECDSDQEAIQKLRELREKELKND